MLALYFYRARKLTIRDRDLRDSSCRPDPDFDNLSLGLCRPNLRKKMADLAQSQTSLDVLFYTGAPAKTGELLLVALLRVSTVYREHNSARGAFAGVLPRNLIVTDNPCLLGTTINPVTEKASSHQQASSCGCEKCGCDNYAQRSKTPYLIFAPTGPGTLRLDNPVVLRFDDLNSIAPYFVRQEWPTGINPRKFQQATQNGAHWFEHPDDAQALRNYFLNSGSFK